MTAYERVHAALRLFDHPLRQHVGRTLRGLQNGRPLDVLDVGGRRSQYTIGLTGRVTVSDIPRETALQHDLDLGATDALRETLMARRSNVVDYVIDDMTQTQLSPASFDVVVAVEVLEHVDEDAAFVRNVARVLRDGGTFVLTTPNGDFLPTHYGDHKRHYRRAQLAALLATYFADVTVAYGVNHGRLLTWGVQALSARHPLRTFGAVLAVAIAAWGERAGIGGRGPHGKRHLIATAGQPRREIIPANPEP
jgi:2-polyprenyl-3-methyl-5-hydroxy-6-metoxy-1,4-benzoquinol methylase